MFCAKSISLFDTNPIREIRLQQQAETNPPNRIQSIIIIKQLLLQFFGVPSTTVSKAANKDENQYEHR
jgi:hypothetical protein